MTIIKMFNKQIISLITELINYFNDNKKKILKEKIIIVNSANPSLIIRLFFENVYKYKDIIMEKDETFFLEQINEDNISKLYNKNKQLAEKNNINIMDVINLKDYWESLSSDDKDVIWKYLQVLIVLTEKWVLNNINNT